jgi:hypothetical protein
MTTWKLCIALIREYGFFTELRDLDFSKFAPLVNKKMAVPLADGTKLQVNYREVDKLLRTLPDEGLAVKHDNFSTSTTDPINDKPVKR